MPPLGEQVEYIFITQQVVNEVIRNKMQVATDFLGQKSKGLKLQWFNVPDHLAGSAVGQSDGILQDMREIGQRIGGLNNEVDSLFLGIMEQISLSKDEVSKALAPIFSKAVSHSCDELKKARNRRELGNPPGKSTSPIGDQLTWEQILTHFRGKKRLWIISRDGDYGIKFGGEGFLNSLLYSDLSEVASTPEVYLFEDMVQGITHFVETTGVKAEKKLTQREAEEIEAEERALPHPGQTGQDMRRALAELVRLNQSDEELRRTFGELTKLSQPTEELRRTIAEFTRLRQPTEELRRTIAEFTRLSQPTEDLRRTIAEFAKLDRPDK